MDELLQQLEKLKQIADRLKGSLERDTEVVGEQILTSKSLAEILFDGLEELHSGMMEHGKASKSD